MGGGHIHDGEHSHLLEQSNTASRKGELDALAERKQQEARHTATKLKKATMFVLIFFVVEIIGGVMAGSLAILTDAAHLLTDVSSFILAIVANEIASRPACEKLTYGPVRAEVLSALASTVLILLLSAVLVYEAFYRIILISKGGGVDIDGKLMTLIASIGLLVNIILLFILGDHDDIGGFGGHDHGHGHAHHPKDHKEQYHSLTESNKHDHDHDHDHDHGHGHGHGHSSDSHSSHDSDIEAAVHSHDQNQGNNKSKVRNLNLEAATLHAITDLVQSFGVLLAGLLIWWKPEWKIADPIVTLVFVVLVLNYTRTLLGHALNVLLEGVPEAFSYASLKQELLAIEGVSDVHCLHIWSLTLGRIVVTAHLKADDPDSALRSAHTLLENMGVVHSTIQIQRDSCVADSCDHPCVSKASECCE